MARSTNPTNLPASAGDSIVPFTVDIPQQKLDALQALLKACPVSDKTYENTRRDRSLGISHGWLSNAVETWRTSFDWWVPLLTSFSGTGNSFPSFCRPGSEFEPGKLYPSSVLDSRHFALLHMGKPMNPRHSFDSIDKRELYADRLIGSMKDTSTPSNITGRALEMTMDGSAAYTLLLCSPRKSMRSLFSCSTAGQAGYLISSLRELEA